ncbi:extracellular solute-binding protein [Bifidobacterium fermentum]|uniref:Extracellular solute-binding protein n=2 Tax=Bifidobacterium fermentum TaxID=3059035 RepID=A0AB39UCB6_9BIFI
MGFSGTDEVATSRMDLAKTALGGKVKVRLAEGTLDTQQLLSQIATGDPPDLIYIGRDRIGSLAARNALIPLEDCIAGEAIDTGDFIPSALSQVTLNDKVYGIPEFNVVQITMANADLLRQANVSITDVNGSDRTAMSVAAKSIYSLEGRNSDLIGVDSKIPEFLPLWVKAAGADMMSKDGRTARLDSKEAIDSLAWAANIYEEQGGFSRIKSIRDSADTFGEGNQFASGTLGVMPMEQWYINTLNSVTPNAPMVFDTVRNLKGHTIAFASGSAWAIPKGSKNAPAACRWARVMTSTAAWKKAASTRLADRKKEGGDFTGLLTGNQTADREIRTMVTAASMPWSSAVDAMYEANDHTFSMPANPADAEFTAAWQEAVGKVLNKEIPAKQALGEAQETAQKALDAAWTIMDRGN